MIAISAMPMIGRSPSRGRGLGLSVRDLNQQTPAAARQQHCKALPSKTPFRSTPRPPQDWAVVRPAATVAVPPAVVSRAAVPPAAVQYAPTILDSRLQAAVDQWKEFRTTRRRHLELLVQVSLRQPVHRNLLVSSTVDIGRV